MSGNSLHLAVGRACLKNNVIYGSRDGCWVVPGIAHPGTHPAPTTPGTPPPTERSASGLLAARTVHVPGVIWLWGSNPLNNSL